MYEKKIKLNGSADVTEFVRAAENCRFDIDVCYNRICVDGKSVLGVLGMDLTRVLTVRYEGINEEFEAVLAKFEGQAHTAA